MSRNTRLDDLDPETGPFRVPESAFPDAGGPEGGFTDEDVERAMSDAGPSYVSEGPPEFEAEPPPTPRPPLPPPPPPAYVAPSASSAPSRPTPSPAPRHGSDEPAAPRPGLYVDAEDDPPIPPLVTDRPGARGRAAPAESSGLVMEIGGDSSAPVAEQAEPDVGSSALNSVALVILAAVIGLGGAGCVLAVLLQLSGGEEPVAVEAVEEDVGIPVRRTLNAPKPNFIEDNIREFEEREAAGEAPDGPTEAPDGEAPTEAPDGEAPAEAPPREVAAPIGNKLP